MILCVSAREQMSGIHAVFVLVVIRTAFVRDLVTLWNRTVRDNEDGAVRVSRAEESMTSDDTKVVLTV